MSYFDLDYGRAYSIKTPEVYGPKSKQEIIEWQSNSSPSEYDYERMKEKMAKMVNTTSNTGWNSYWTEQANPFNEYIPDDNTIPSEEIRKNLPDEYKDLSLEELSEKLLEDENGQEILKKAIAEAKSRNVKEKKANEYEDWEALRKAVDETFKKQQYHQATVPYTRQELNDLRGWQDDLHKGYDYFNLDWKSSSD